MPSHRAVSALLSAPLLAVCLGACGSSDIENPPPPPVDPRVYQTASLRTAVVQKDPFTKERETLAAIGNALAADDMKKMAEFIDPEADFSFPGMSDASNRDGMLKACGDLFSPFSNRKYAASRIWQIGEAAVVEWSMLAIQSGEFMNVRATGKPVGIHGLSLYFFNLNGLVNDIHVYFDIGAILAQLGAAPKGVETPPLPPLAPTPEAFVAEGTPSDITMVNASWDAFEAKNAAGYLAPMADDVEVFRFDRATPEHGKDARKKYFDWIARGLSSLSQTPLNAWSDGPFVIEEYYTGGVNSGKMTPDAPASGHAVRVHLVDIDEIREGKIKRIWTFGNSLELLAQIGIVPKATPGNNAPLPGSCASGGP
jgi:predicted ester cyclase